MKLLRRVPLIAALILAILGGVTQLRAQSATTGALSGIVTDPSGSAVAGASVILINPATGQTQSQTTGTNGAYAFPTLVPGTYSLKFSAQGFKTMEMLSVVVNVSEAPAVDAK